jgi:c-di-GMP-binding flagellar brake protein YcgR
MTLMIALKQTDPIADVIRVCGVYSSGCVGLSGQSRTEKVVRTHQRPGDPSPSLVENRRHPRYKLEVAIKIYPRNQSVIRGHTVDISESGISAMLRDEAPMDEVVRLEFTLPYGDVEVLALARQRHAFRFGFEFLEDTAAREIIRHTCRKLAMEESLPGKA